MSFDNMPTAESGTSIDPFSKLRAALASQDEQTPEIVAIFQQIKNLRESDRSLRSIRRNLELDNMPVIETAEDATDDGATPQGELAVLLDSFLKLQKEKEALSDRLVQMISATDQLEAKVNHLTALVERQTDHLGQGQD